MLFVRLAQLMANKRLKIADVCKDVEISRPTLTALYYGTSKGINFDTVNKLCSYFRCQTNDLLYFYNVDIEAIEITNFDDSLTPDKNGEWPGPVEPLHLCQGEILFKSFQNPKFRTAFVLDCTTAFDNGRPFICIDFHMDNKVSLPYLPENLRFEFGERLVKTVFEKIQKEHNVDIPTEPSFFFDIPFFDK